MPAGQKEVNVQLTDRVVLSPFAAKRLSILLNNILTDYEKKFGQLEIGIEGRKGRQCSKYQLRLKKRLAAILACSANCCMLLIVVNCLKNALGRK